MSTNVKRHTLKSFVWAMLAIATMATSAFAQTDDYPYKTANSNNADPWGFYYRNCTSFVAWRMNRDGDPQSPTQAPFAFWNTMYSSKWSHAKYWDDIAIANGIVVDNIPEVGAIAQWNENTPGWSGANGHVGYISAVSGNQVTIEWYNTNSDYKYHRQTTTANKIGRVIHFIKRTPPPTTNCLVNATGQTVFDEPNSVNDRNACVEFNGPVGNWVRVVGCGNESDYFYTWTGNAVQPVNWAIWKLNFSTAGNYKIEQYIPCQNAYAQNGRYEINHAGRTDFFALSQAGKSNWQPIGTYYFAAGTGQYVRLNDNTGERYPRRQLGFDAIRITRVSSVTAPEGGSAEVTSVENDGQEEATTLSSFQLHQNSPNPFNPNTTIAFTLPTSSRVKLQVFNTAGQLVKTLANGDTDAGEHSVMWDARNETGEEVPTGIYLYRIEVNGQSETRKMTLLK